MLISKTAKVQWNPHNRKYYTNLGYHFTKVGDVFEVKVEELLRYSHSLITYECDYCHDLSQRSWGNYITNRGKTVSKDCCDKCRAIKQKEVFLIKYGVTNTQEIPGVKEKMKRTSLERYGVENYGAIWSKEHSGELSPSWKGDAITERLERNSLDYKQWRKNVFDRDLYTCKCCGARNGNGKYIRLEAHHIFNFGKYLEKRYDVDNGITLCQECHIDFHRKYGKQDNTIKQLEEFYKLKNPESKDKKIC